VENSKTHLGWAMRKLNWARDCHTTKEDEGLWRSVSEAFANYAVTSSLNPEYLARLSGEALYRMTSFEKDEILHSRGRKYNAPSIFINYPAAKLPSTFLFRFELEIIGRAATKGWSEFSTENRVVEVFDFKTGCNRTILQDMHQKLNKDRLSQIVIECRSPVDSSGAGFARYARMVEACEG